MSPLSQFAREYYSRVRTHGQAVADGVGTTPDATSAASHRAPGPGGAPKPTPGPDVRLPVPAGARISVCPKCERIFAGAGSQCDDCGGDW